MSTNKRRKNSRNQGSNTHGWGRNQHRKSGTRGGVGNAGTGKKCHANKTKIWTNPNYLGKHGFTPRAKDECVINLGVIQDRLSKWKAQGKVTDNSGVVQINLLKLGYNRLLGCGKLTSKVKITVPMAAKTVAKKVQAAGGELVVTST